MVITRRIFLKKTLLANLAQLALSAGLLRSKVTFANPLPSLFSSDSIENMVVDGVKIKTIELSDKINLQIPMIAENGAVVPLSVSCTLDTIEKIYIIVAKNPVPLIAIFNLSLAVDALVSTRIKMAETSAVIVIAKTQSGLYKTQQQVKVTLGGCGG
jgi:sulfur-oxidizing protein SoxY